MYKDFMAMVAFSAHLSQDIGLATLAGLDLVTSHILIISSNSWKGLTTGALVIDPWQYVALSHVLNNLNKA